ncbi:MAG TPA: membrane dipeptidase [Clostridiaceae bacterium]|nr:membrane dipeptidase [Clostridiaceae bacterium]
MRCIIDGHCDTLSKALDTNTNLNNSKFCFYLDIVKDNVPYIQLMAAYVDPEYVRGNMEKGGFYRAINILNKFEEEKNNENIINILNKYDLNRVILENKIGVILTIENGSAISGDINNIEKLFKKGVRVMSVTWNEDNDLGCGALTKNDKGLTKLGIEYIKKMEKINILIDISHSSEKTFWDIIKNTNNTIVATHSCVNSVCNHPRNLKDRQIIEIAKRKGIIGICFASEFLNEYGKSTSHDIVKHIKYIKELVGIDYVGLGSDFDGVEETKMPLDIRNVKHLKILEDKMKLEGFTSEEISKVMGENWLRVLNDFFLN